YVFNNYGRERRLGNTNINLHDIRQCPEDYEKLTDCVDLGSKRLYANQQWQLQLPKTEGKLIVRKQVANEYSVDEY
ncbi:MAG: hypothetical protein GQ569_07065, partial [Methylococcaceae bacterium]|nr:hypothetical protein [Methylococcaceae bacterium]